MVAKARQHDWMMAGGKGISFAPRCPLFWSLSGVKRTSVAALHMSAFDPKRTWLSEWRGIKVRSVYSPIADTVALVCFE
jgi:hypothetical protein